MIAPITNISQNNMCFKGMYIVPGHSNALQNINSNELKELYSLIKSQQHNKKTHIYLFSDKGDNLIALIRDAIFKPKTKYYKKKCSQHFWESKISFIERCCKIVNKKDKI